MTEREHKQHHPDLAPPAVSQASTGAKYTCPMHPEIVRDAPGDCPIWALGFMFVGPLGRYRSLWRRHRGANENRARLLIEVVEAISEVWDADRVGVRLSPLGTFNDISDDDPETTFGYIAKELSDYRLAYLHLVNPAVAAIEQGTEPDPRAIRMLALLREKYRGTLVLAGGFDQDTAEAWLEQGASL